jgi:hypothetical protein
MADLRNRKKPVGGDGKEIRNDLTTPTQSLLQGVRDRVRRHCSVVAQMEPKIFCCFCFVFLSKQAQQVNAIYREQIDGVGNLYRYRSRPSKGEITASPLVFFLGNHSSGKSSFVNFLLNRDTLQKTGTAPLDDCFTVITYGDTLGEKDGPAVVSNKNLPFSSKTRIGNGCFVLKTKNCSAWEHFRPVYSG